MSDSVEAPIVNNAPWYLAAVSCFVIWGLLPLYVELLNGFSPAIIVSNRILWSVLLLSLILAVSRGRGKIRNILRQPKLLGRLALSGTAIGMNWSIYIWAIAHHHAVEASLGYFINPMINVLFGVGLLGERLSRQQWLSVALAALGVTLLIAIEGKTPWISLGLACSFATYGLLRKTTPVDAFSGLWVETVLLAVPSAIYLMFFSAGGGGEPHDLARLALLASSAIMTVLPLSLFNLAAQRLPLSTMGLFQYIAPSLVLLIGITEFKEPFDAVHLASFSLIWLGLALYTADLFRRSDGRNAVVVKAQSLAVTE